MLTDTAAPHALLCKQDAAVTAERITKPLRQRMYHCKFVHIHANALLRGQFRGRQRFLSLCAIGHERRIRGTFRTKHVVFQAAAAQSGQRFVLRAARVTQRTRAVFQKEPFQPICQFCVIAGRNDLKTVELTEKRGVIDTLMRLAVTGHKAGAVYREKHAETLQIDVVNDLVVTALQECGID